MPDLYAPIATAAAESFPYPVSTISPPAASAVGTALLPAMGATANAPQATATAEMLLPSVQDSFETPAATAIALAWAPSVTTGMQWAVPIATALATASPPGSMLDPLTPAGSPFHNSLEHIIGGRTLPITTPTEIRRVGSFRDRHDLNGGPISASGVISSAEYAAHPTVYVENATWLVRDTRNDVFVFGGKLSKPEESAGEVVLQATGWGQLPDETIERLLFENQNVSMWMAGDQEPFTFNGTASIKGEVVRNSLVFEINRYIAFPQHQGAPNHWDSVPLVFWAPKVDLRRIAFTITRSKNDNDYDLELVGVHTGPDGNLATLQSWSLGAAGPATVDYAIEAGWDLIGLRVRRLTPVKKAKHRRFKLTNVRVGAIATDDSFTVSDGFSYLFQRMGVNPSGVVASTQVMTPYDAAMGTYGDVMDDIARLDSYIWRVEPDGSGSRVGIAEPLGNVSWHVVRTRQPLKLLPQRRYNKVQYEYVYGGGYTSIDTVTASSDPFPGESVVYKLSLEEPPIKILAEAFAQKVADYLAQERRSGRASLLYVTSGGNEYESSRIKPGHKLILDNYDNAEVIVSSLSHSEDGHVVEVEFSEGDPTLDKLLARRIRKLNQGLDANAATLAILDPEEPAVPTFEGGVPTYHFYQADARKGERRYNLVLDWDAVTQDIDGNPTAVDHYIARARPVDAAGDPIPKNQGGGWRYRQIREPKEDDSLLIETPTTATFENLDRPHAWRWEYQVRAEDLLHQLSAWSTLTNAGKPSTFLPDAPTDATVNVRRHSVNVAWDAPEDPEDTDAILKQIKPEIDHFQVQVSDDDWATVLKFDRGVRATHRRFWVKKTRGKDFDARVRSVDAYGNKSAWVEAVGAEDAPSIPTNLTITWGRVRERWGRVVGKFVWTESEWTEGDIDDYIVQIQSTHPDDPSFTDSEVIMRRWVVDARRDDDPNDYAQIRRRCSKNLIHRFRVRAVSDGVKGGWSDWFPASGGSSPTDTTEPPTPLDVLIFDKSTNRVVVDWETPTMADYQVGGDEELPHPDVAYFQVQIHKNQSFSDLYKFDKYQIVTKRGFRIADAQQDDTFYARVRTIDGAGNKSQWVPATAAGNSDPGAIPTGVKVGKPGRHIFVFSLNGNAEVKVYKPPERAEDNLTVRKVTGDFDDVPTGSDLIIDILVGGSSIFSGQPNMLHIDHGGNGSGSATTIQDTSITDGQRVKVEVKQVGSGQPGGNGTIRVVCDR